MDFRSLAGDPKDVADRNESASETPRSPTTFLFLVIVTVVTALGALKILWG